MTDDELSRIVADVIAFKTLAAGVPDSPVLPEMAARCIQHIPALLDEIQQLRKEIEWRGGWLELHIGFIPKRLDDER